MKQREKLIGAIILSVIFSIFLFLGYSNSREEEIEEVFTETSIKPMEKEEISFVTVEIKGAVKRPEVYSLEKGSIVKDLVNKAGGYLEEADRDSIIQAKKLKDGECIYVKIKGQVAVPANNYSLPANDSEHKIDLNSASKQELMELEGIGESRADKIIKYREENGAFKSIDELKKVGGRIGDSIINNIKDHVEIN